MLCWDALACRATSSCSFVLVTPLVVNNKQTPHGKIIKQWCFDLLLEFQHCGWIFPVLALLTVSVGMGKMLLVIKSCPFSQCGQSCLLEKALTYLPHFNSWTIKNTTIIILKWTRGYLCVYVSMHQLLRILPNQWHWKRDNIAAEFARGSIQSCTWD